MEKQLTEKQMLALELLTCGKGLSYKEICERVGIGVRTLYDWRHSADFRHFQEELKRLEDERWLAIVDAAKASARRLIEGDNQKMTEFVLKNAGYNPSTKVEADVKQTIDIIIEE